MALVPRHVDHNVLRLPSGVDVSYNVLLYCVS